MVGFFDFDVYASSLRTARLRQNAYENFMNSRHNNNILFMLWSCATNTYMPNRSARQIWV